MLFLWKSQNRLVYKLIVSILLFSGTITVIITAIQLYAEYRRDVNDIDVFISKIEKSFLSPIASSLWHFDMQSVRLQLEGILRFRDIEYLEITEEGNKVVVVGSPQTKHVIVKSIPLIYNFKNQDREIGKLTVAASLARIYSRLFDRAISLLISQGIKTFLVSSFILMIFHLLVTRHLGSINSYLKSLDLKNLPRPLRLKRRVSTKHDELDQVVDSTNEMAVNLHESYQTIDTELELRKQAEEKLSIAYKDIEKRIEERTAQLRKTNEQLRREIIERNQAKEALRKEKDFSESLIDTAQVIILVLDTEGRIIRFNSYMEELCGYKLDEVQGRDWFSTFLPEENYDQIRELFRTVASDIKTQGNINPVVSKDGREIVVEWYDKTLKDADGKTIGLLAIGQDITERKLAEEKVKASLEEKEILLREIHHRVKNNMQVMISLLSLQSKKIKEKQYVDMLKESQDRIKSMALIHEKLYQSKDFANIDFDGYVKALVNSLFVSHGAHPDRIASKIEIKDISLGLDYAIPCGLIINELISNSFKYAFPNEREGEIRIGLQEMGENEVELTVSDNGIGIPEELDLGTIESMGLDLVKILAEHQLGGKIELKRAGGTSFSIRFTVKTDKARI